MYKIIYILVWFLGSCFTLLYSQPQNSLSLAERRDGWQLLFDGKTMEGWRYFKNKEAGSWGVEQGMLYCKGSETDKSDMRADLITNETYTDFELNLEWKLSPQGNSGIMYHVSEKYSASYLSGPEYQIIDDNNFPTPLEDWQKTAADYAMYTPQNVQLKPIGEFNQSRIIIKGPHREYWLNGVKVLEFEAWSTDWQQRKKVGKWKDTPSYGMEKSGHICLQDHGSGIWFRNIKIRKL